MNYIPRKTLLATLISSALLVSGCGGGGSSTPGADDTSGGSGNSGETGNSGNLPDPTVNPYSGSSNISGVISLSSLNGQDSGSLGNTSGEARKAVTRSMRAGENIADNAILKLFQVAANGDLKETGIECAFDADKDANGNPTYSCEGIADGNNYVIKYLRILENNKALEMKVNVQIPEGQADVPADAVSPQSTVVADTIVNAILSATEGKEIDQEILDDIIASVEKVVKNLVASGAVQVPSMVVDAPKGEDGEFITDAASLGSEEKVVFAENEGLETTSGSLLSGEEVAAEVDAVKVEIEIREISNVDVNDGEGKRELVNKIFEKLLDDDGEVPRFILDFFTKQFEENATVDVASLYDAILAGMEVDQELVNFSISDFEISSTTTTADLQSTLDEIYTLFAKRDGGSLEEGDKEQLADIPGIIPAIFPEGTVVTTDTVLNIPQAIVYTIFVSEKYIPEVIEEETGLKTDEFISVDNSDDESTGPVNVEFERVVEFNPMHFDEQGDNPGLMQLFGFFDEDYLNNLSGVDIDRLDVHPDTIWIQDQDSTGTGNRGQEYDVLRANVCVSDLSAMAGMLSGSAQEISFDVELSYPTKSGSTGSVKLQNERDLYSEGDEDRGGPDMESCFTLDPWASAQSSTSPNGYQPTLEGVVHDFKSGEYKVTVRNPAGEVVAERAFQQKVIVGMRNASPRLVSPKGRPQWPAECQATDYCEKWTELENEYNKQGATTFALNIDSEPKDGTADKAEVTMKWEKPDVELPDGVRIAYSLDVVLNATSNGDYRWENIYSSHQDDKRIYGSSFTLPVMLDKLELGDGGKYHVNVCAEFIDTDSGDYLGRGGCGFAEFNVGEPLDMNAEFTIEGKAPAGLDSSWKVALISENYQQHDDAGTATKPERITKAITSIDADGKYFLTPTIGDFLSGSFSAYNSIILFKDENDDGEPLNSPENSQYEPEYWPDWESNVWFETWDRVLRVVTEESHADGEHHRNEVIVTGGETVSGPDFSSLQEEEWFLGDVTGQPDEKEDPTDGEDALQK